MYASELAELTARVAARYPGDDDAHRAAEYAHQVVREHSYPAEITTNDLAHVLQDLGYGDWSAEILDGHASEDRHALPRDYRICGQPLYRDGQQHAVCVMPWGTEHDHG
jgi:hypothetical protein